MENVQSVRLENNHFINGRFDENGTFTALNGHRCRPLGVGLYRICGMHRVKPNIEFTLRRIREINEFRRFIRNLPMPCVQRIM